MPFAISLYHIYHWLKVLSLSQYTILATAMLVLIQFIPYTFSYSWFLVIHICYSYLIISCLSAYQRIHMFTWMVPYMHYRYHVYLCLADSTHPACHFHNNISASMPCESSSVCHIIWLFICPYQILNSF